MGNDSPRSFPRSDWNIILSEIMEPITGADENDAIGCNERGISSWV